MIPVGLLVGPGRGKGRIGCRYQHQAGWALWWAAQQASHRGRLQWSRPPKYLESGVKYAHKKHAKNKNIAPKPLLLCPWTALGKTNRFYHHKIKWNQTHLPCGFHPFPDAEVTHHPGDEQTQGQVPVQRTHVVDAGGNPQCSSPAETQ